MIKRLVIIIFVLKSSWAIAQETDSYNAYYLYSELNLGNYVGVDFNLNYVINNKYSLKLGFSGNIRKPKSEPENFSGGLKGLFSVGIENPYDHLLNYKIDLGRIYNLNPKKTIRANLAVGMGYTIIKEPENWELVESDVLLNLTENYTYTYRSYSTLSLIISPKIEFPITRFFGLSVSPTIQLNKDRSYFGIGLGTLLGKLK